MKLSASKRKQLRRENRAKLRAGLPPLPKIMRDLDVDDRGYPIPWFVQRDPVTGIPDFRVMEAGRIVEAVRSSRCWITGQPLRTDQAVFVVGPMCVFSGRSAEPPSIQEAAEYAAVVCPFLAIPTAKRREAGLNWDQLSELPGIALKENPGITALYKTSSYHLEQVGDGVLFVVGQATSIRWFKEGRELTPDEVSDPFGLVHEALEKATRERFELVWRLVAQGGKGLVAAGQEAYHEKKSVSGLLSDDAMRAKVVAEIMREGPYRVMESDGYAIPFKEATEKGITIDVVFIRSDGWSLGAPASLERAAYETWAGGESSWTHVVKDNDLKPIEEYQCPE